MTFSRYRSSTVCLTSLYNELNAFHSSRYKNTGHMTYSQLHKIPTSFITLLKRRVPTKLNTKCFQSVSCYALLMIALEGRYGGFIELVHGPIKRAHILAAKGVNSAGYQLSCSG